MSGTICLTLSPNFLWCSCLRAVLAGRRLVVGQRLAKITFVNTAQDGFVSHASGTRPKQM